MTTDRRTIKGANHQAIVAYVTVRADTVSLATLAKLPALRHHKNPLAAVKRAVKTLEADGFLTYDVEAQTVERAS